MEQSVADRAYSDIFGVLGKNGKASQRKYGSNPTKNCTCQGLDDSMSGASFSFGCSWSMYFNGCKFGKYGFRPDIKKLKLNNLATEHDEDRIETTLQLLATYISPLFKKIVPIAYKNMTLHDKEAKACRIGYHTENTFAGASAVLDFCAHSLVDLNNMIGGCTAVATLTVHSVLRCGNN